MRIRTMWASAILTAMPIVAYSAKLATPLAFAGATQAITCSLTNVGTRDVAIKNVEARDPDGTRLAPFFSSCVGALAPGASCTGSLPPGVDAWCLFDVRGKVRASLGVYDANGGGLVSGFPATTK